MNKMNQSLPPAPHGESKLHAQQGQIAQMEAELASELELSTLHQAILDHAELAIIVTTVDGVIQILNPAAERMLGYSTAEVIGRMTLERFHDPAEVEQCTAALATARGDSITPGFAALLEYARRNVLTLHEWTFIHQDGSRFPVQLAICTLRNHQGETIGLVSLAQDITERKYSERRLHEALEREQELNERKSRLVSMASHEFRTPLSTILATTETLAAYRDRMSAELIDGRLEKIRRQVLHLRNIIEAVLLLSRLQAGQAPLNLMTADLDALCQEIVNEFQHQPDNRHRLLYTCNRQPLLVSMDPRLMGQVISNLIANAIKYSPEAENIYIELTLMGANAILCVRDEGMGIPEVDREHLFDPFHRGTHVGTIPGLGLGLSLVKQIVELHQGMITVDSQPGRGTTVSISIPTSLKE